MHPNEKLLRQAIEARAAGDESGLAHCLHPEMVLHFPGTSALAGDHHGPGSFGAKVRQITGHPLRIDVYDVLASDEHAVGVYLLHAERDGRSIQWRQVNVYRVSGGQIVEVWQHPFDQHAVDEFFGE